jgi:hypothetical protein
MSSEKVLVTLGNISPTKMQKMVFIFNAIERGWTVKKAEDSYVFTKKHEKRREVFREDYLENFIVTNFEG